MSQKRLDYIFVIHSIEEQNANWVQYEEFMEKYARVKCMIELFDKA